MSDMKDGGTWTFMNNETTVTFGWRPSEDGPQCFLITVGVENGVITAVKETPYPDFNIERWRGVGIRLLSATSGLLLPSCIHRELNDLFGPTYKEMVLRSEDYKSEPRLVRDIGLNHPNPVVKKAFENAQKMYQGKALDDQKDPSKVH